VYRKVSPEFPIPVDSCGKARLFTLHEKTKKKSQGETDTNNNKETLSWYCNPQVCNVTADMITGTVSK